MQPNPPGQTNHARGAVARSTGTYIRSFSVANLRLR